MGGPKGGRRVWIWLTGRPGGGGGLDGVPDDSRPAMLYDALPKPSTDPPVAPSVFLGRVVVAGRVPCHCQGAPDSRLPPAGAPSLTPALSSALPLPLTRISSCPRLYPCPKPAPALAPTPAHTPAWSCWSRTALQRGDISTPVHVRTGQCGMPPPPRPPAPLRGGAFLPLSSSAQGQRGDVPAPRSSRAAGTPARCAAGT